MTHEEFIKILETDNNYQKNLNDLVKLFNMYVFEDDEERFIAFGCEKTHGEHMLDYSVQALKDGIFYFAIQYINKNEKITKKQIDQLKKILYVLKDNTKQKDYYYFVINLHNKLKEAAVY